MIQRVRDMVGITGLITFLVSFLAAYITHLVWVINTLSSAVVITFGQFVLSMFGVFIPPIGALHGVIIWLSALF